MSPALALAEEVLVNTQKLVEELRRGENSENTIMRAKAADDFLTTSEKLSAALYGPTKAAFYLVAEQFDLAALKFVLKFDVLKHMDREGGTNVVELSKRINIDAGFIGRFLRLLSTRDLVKETGNGVFELTATSKAIIDDDEVYSCFAFM
jgi:predicted transcriptional regulator